MKDVGTAALLSLEMEKGRHVVAASTALVSTTPPVMAISELLPLVGISLGAVASGFVIFKTYLEIKIKRIELSRIERRE